MPIRGPRILAALNSHAHAVACLLRRSVELPCNARCYFRHYEHVLWHCSFIYEYYLGASSDPGFFPRRRELWLCGILHSNRNRVINRLLHLLHQSRYVVYMLGALCVTGSVALPDNPLRYVYSRSGN